MYILHLESVVVLLRFEMKRLVNRTGIVYSSTRLPVTHAPCSAMHPRLRGIT